VSRAASGEGSARLVESRPGVDSAGVGCVAAAAGASQTHPPPRSAWAWCLASVSRRGL
jgi:hypothetical protein